MLREVKKLAQDDTFEQWLRQDLKLSKVNSRIKSPLYTTSVSILMISWIDCQRERPQDKGRKMDGNNLL